MWSQKNEMNYSAGGTVLAVGVPATEAQNGEAVELAEVAAALSRGCAAADSGAKAFARRDLGANASVSCCAWMKRGGRRHHRALTALGDHRADCFRSVDCANLAGNVAREPLASGSWLRSAHHTLTRSASEGISVVSLARASG